MFCADGKSLNNQVEESRIMDTLLRLRWPNACSPRFVACVLAFLITPMVANAQQDDPPKTTEIKAADGRLTIQVPAAWERQEPSIRMIEHEYQAAADEQDDAPARMTMMMAGGTVKANLDRWISQFQMAADGPKPKEESMEVGGQKIHLIDLQGTYLDRRGPFAPPTAREDYRMLGAVVEVKGGGLFFVKFYGPQATIAKHAPAFESMVKSIKAD
jgi:hypothetical protein